jgi:hypothetical protein
LITRVISDRAAVVFAGAWDLEVIDAPRQLQRLMFADLPHISQEVMVAASEKADLAADKIFLVALTTANDRPAIAVRELDVRTRELSDVVYATCAGTAEMPLALWDAMAEAFTPLARIEQVEQRTIVARLRAGGLISNEASSANVQPGMTLRPVIRRNDRTGQPAKGGLQPIPWTLLTVDEWHGSVLDCTLHSGYRTAIPPRGGVRMERLALLVRAKYPATRLTLRSRSDAAKPLVAYEVYRRVGDEEPELLGHTDDQGAIVIPATEGSLQTLVIRNGKQLLARLPIVPGQEESLTAEVVDDDARLAAEGFVASMDSRALDLVARREVIASRIRARLKDGQLPEAQQLLDQYRRLESRADLNRDLDRYRQQVVTSDKLTQVRIDRLLADAQKTFLLKPLSDDMLAQLTREVTQARAAPPAAEAKSGGN